MAIDVGTVRGSIALDTSSFRNDLKSSQQAAENFSKSVGGSFSGLKGVVSGVSGAISSSFETIGKVGSTALKGLQTAVGLTVKALGAVSGGIGAVAFAGMKYNSEMEQYTAQLETLTGSGEKAADVLQQIKKMGAETPFESKDLISATKTMMSFGISADDALKNVRILGDVSMGNADKLGSLTLAFSQVSSTGKLMGQDLLQMINAGFNPLQIMSEQTGKSMGQLKDEMADGAISAEMVADAFAAATEKGGLFYGAMEKQSKTFEGQISTLKDNVSSLVGTLTEGMQKAFSTDLVPAINEAVGKISEAAKNGGLKEAIAAIGEEFGNLAPKILGYLPKVVESATGLLVGFADAIAKNSAIIASGALEIVKQFASGVSQALPALGTAAASIVKEISNQITVQSASDTISSGVAFIKSFVSSVASAVPALADAAMAILGGIAKYLLENQEQMSASSSAIIRNITNGVAKFADKFLDTAVVILTALVKYVSEQLPVLAEGAAKIITFIAEELLSEENLVRFMESGSAILEALGKAITDNIGSLMGTAAKILDNLTAALTSGDGESGEAKTSAAVAFLSSLAKAIMDNIGTLLNSAKTLLIALLQKITAFTNENGEAFVTAAINFMQKIILELQNTLRDGKIVKALADLGTALATAILSAWWKQIQLELSGKGNGPIGFQRNVYANDVMREQEATEKTGGKATVAAVNNITINGTTKSSVETVAEMNRQQKLAAEGAR